MMLFWDKWSNPEKILPRVWVHWFCNERARLPSNGVRLERKQTLSSWKEPSALQHLARPSLYPRKSSGSGCRVANYLYGNDYPGAIHSDLGPPLGHWPSKNPVPGWSWTTWPGTQRASYPAAVLSLLATWSVNHSGFWEDRVISPSSSRVREFRSPWNWLVPYST